MEKSNIIDTMGIAALSLTLAHAFIDESCPKQTPDIIAKLFNVEVQQACNEGDLYPDHALVRTPEDQAWHVPKTIRETSGRNPTEFFIGLGIGLGTIISRNKATSKKENTKQKKRIKEI